MRVNKGLAVFASVALAALLVAASSKTLDVFEKDSGSFNILNGVDAGTDASLRTVTRDVRGYSRVAMFVDLTDANTDCTSLEVTCSGSLDGGTTYGNYTSRAISAGVGTVTDFYDTIARAEVIDGTVLFYDVWGLDYFKCVYSVTGTCASDTITVQWSKSADK